MQPADILAYSFMLISMTLAPGPLMAVVIARTMGRDVSGATAFSFGIASGNVIIVGLVSSGLGVWLSASPGIFEAVKYGALGYLLWVSYAMWRSNGSQDRASSDNSASSISSAFAGMFTCFASPHYIVLYLLFLPKLVDLSSVSGSTISGLAMLTFVALAATFGAVIVIANRCRGAMLSGSNTQLINRALASVIAASGIWMVAA